MNFAEAVKVCLFEKYSDFSGRASRAEYWWYHLFYFTICFGGLSVVGIAAVMGVSDEVGPFLVGLWLLTLLPLVIPTLAVTVRRFHDRDMSGWIYFLLCLVASIPCAGIIGTIAIFVIALQRGTVGPNHYGSDPYSYDNPMFA